MVDDDYKKYTESARRGIKGEAFFESLIVDHAIPHRIARQNDLGIDFLCEWISGDRPSGILFTAQIKTTTSDQVNAEFVKKSCLNGLDIYTLKRVTKIDKRTVKYWEGLGLPAFLFIVIEDKSDGAGRMACYYKRYTPLMDGNANEDDKNHTKLFHKVNKRTSFLAFADSEKEIGGFARDLIIDYVRLSYSKGHILKLTPKQLGFWPFPNKEQPNVARVFGQFVEWHREEIKKTCEWTTSLLDQIK